MSSLPVELLDEILSLAVALGTISPNEATHICRRWRGFQKLLFKTVKLDPLNENILDLNEHSHLIPYIEELHVGGVVPCSGPSYPFYDRDLSASFTNFLCNVKNPSSMVFCDSRIQWASISSKSIDAFLTVFRRDSFRSLGVSVHKPFPFWMLLHGLCVASELIIHYIGPITPPPESARLLSYQCSLTRLVLFGNATVKRIARYCLQQQDLAKVLLQKVIHLVLEYGETDATFGPPISLCVEILIVFLGSQLEVLDFRLRSSNIPPSPISQSAFQNLKTLRHLSVYFTGCSSGSIDTLTLATEYVKSVFSDLPPLSLIKSLSLRVSDRRKFDLAVDDCESKYQTLLQYIHGQVPCAEKWPFLTSSHIFVDVNDDNFAEPIRLFKQTIYPRAESLEIVSLFQVNVSKADDFSTLVTPQMG